MTSSPYLYRFSYEHRRRWHRTAIPAETLQEAMGQLRAMQNVRYEGRSARDGARGVERLERRPSWQRVYLLSVAAAFAAGYGLGLLA